MIKTNITNVYRYRINRLVELYSSNNLIFHRDNMEIKCDKERSFAWTFFRSREKENGNVEIILLCEFD